MLRKCLDTSQLSALSFKPRISLQEGITQTITEYRQLKQEGKIQ